MGQIRIADLPSTTQIDGDSYVIIEKPEVGDGTYKAKVFELQKAVLVTANVTRAGDVITISIQDYSGRTSETLTIPKAKVTTVGNTITIEMKDESGTSTATVTNPTAQIIDRGDGTSEIIMTDSTGTTSSVVVNNTFHFDPEPTEGSTNLISSGAVYDSNKQLADDILVLSDDMSSLKLRLTMLENIVARTVGLELNNSVPSPWPSPQPEEYRFQMNGVGYDSIQDVISNMNSSMNNIVTVNRDVSTSGFRVDGYDVEFNLNGHIWQIAEHKQFSSDPLLSYISLNGNNDIVFKNGTVILNDNTASIDVDAFILTSATNVSIDNVTIDVSEANRAIDSAIVNISGEIELLNSSNIKLNGHVPTHARIYYQINNISSITHVTIDSSSGIGISNQMKVDLIPYMGETQSFCENAGVIAPQIGRDVEVISSGSSYYYWSNLQSEPGYQIFRCHLYN